MRWKITLQFLAAIIIIGIAGNFINTAVMSYNFYLASNGSDVGNMMISFSPKTIDVKKVVRQIRVEGDEKLDITEEAKMLLNESKSWVQVIDDTGKEIESVNKPVLVKNQYSETELANLKREPGILKGYDVFIYQRGPMGMEGVTVAKFAAKDQDIAFENHESASRVVDENKNGDIKIRRPVPDIQYIIGVPKPKITVYTFVYSFYSYIKNILDINPKNAPELVSNILTFLVIVLLGYVFARSLTKPVVKITDGIAAMAEGDLRVSYPEKGLYREVYASLNHMSQQLQSNELERKKIEKMREEWIANISHDLKTPLSSIRGYMELMLEADEELTPEERNKFSKVIMDKSDYMELLLEDLKLTQKLKNDLIPINKEEVDMVELLREVVINILNHPIHGDRKVLFEPELEKVILTADPVLMQRALTNIICNAIIHNPKETSVWVRIMNKKGLSIEIEDNGRGIHKDDLENLFDRYYRGTNTDEACEGSGLGLAISKQIIEAHGGKIELKSEIGEGTKVEVKFGVKQ
jgi:signal transduction histidine kinase